MKFSAPHLGHLIAIRVNSAIANFLLQFLQRISFTTRPVECASHDRAGLTVTLDTLANRGLPLRYSAWVSRPSFCCLKLILPR